MLHPSFVAACVFALSVPASSRSYEPSRPRDFGLASDPSAVQDDAKEEFEKRRKEAEGNPEKLWQLYEWCDARAMEKEGRTVLRAIVKLDDNDRRAHTLLGEVEYDGKWFPNQKKADEYKAKKLEDEAKKTGKVIYEGELVDPADVPKLKAGMKKLEDGRWVSPEEYKRITEGWIRHDLEWVPPTEAANIEKGLFKCGDQWLPEAEADAFHSELGKWWRIPSDHFVIFSTCDRKLTLRARDEMERAYREFNRVLGKSPESAVPVLVLRNLDQFNEQANTQGTELLGFSSLHGATLAENWAEPLQMGMTSAGFCWWDSTDPKLEPFGAMWVRHAAGQAVVEALDPSPKTLAKLMEGKASNRAPDEFWEEKKLPRWFRYGACAYVERYVTDPFIKQGGDPYWMRKWSIENIVNKGGIDPIDSILTFQPTLDDVTKSQKWINQTGLLMSFVLDGKCAPVTQAHQALKDAFKTGKDLKPALKALEEALRKNETELRKYAGV
jgi:hypothetical protein